MEEEGRQGHWSKFEPSLEASLGTIGAIPRDNWVAQGRGPLTLWLWRAGTDSWVPESCLQGGPGLQFQWAVSASSSSQTRARARRRRGHKL